MITLKTGVPGSGKTLSMVSELLANSKLSEPRPVYTNVDGLSIPHIKLTNMEPDTKRVDGVLYTTDWRQCPAGSIIVIDEAFLYGYDAKSAQSSVPEYIRDLAIHRKDYSVDIWFIAQHPKLLHVALRRQVGKHQHYRRLFGWGRAVCYEWDMAQDNLAATKTAVATNFAYPRDVFKAYKSAQMHTKPKFKLPWWAWLPVAILPAAAWAFPAAFNTLSGAMTGKGIPSAVKVPAAPQAPLPSLSLSAPVAPPIAPIASEPVGAFVPQGEKPLVAGCIVVRDRCGCFGPTGLKVETPHDVCIENAGVSDTPKAVVVNDQPASMAGDLDALSFMKEQRRGVSFTDKQLTSLSQIR